MSIRCLIFDKSNQLIDEINPSIKSISWRLNNVGKTVINLPYTDSKCTLTNLQYGNRILISFDSDMPDFGGVIDPPRKQSSSGVMATAYTGEHLFTWRVTEKIHEFITTAPGGVYKRLITQANARRPTSIDVGDIYFGGTPRTLSYHYHDVWGRIKALSDTSGQDFDITTDYVGGQLTFQANWYDVKGIDRSNEIYFIEGSNVKDVGLNEQGAIANQVFLIGEGQTWGAKRYVASESDATSEKDYGYREYSEIQSSVKLNDTLDKNAIQVLSEKKNPRRKFSLEVTNTEPALFGSYGIGDRVTLQVFLEHGDWSYNGKVRICGMEWKSSDSMRLEVEEYE